MATPLGSAEVGIRLSGVFAFVWTTSPNSYLVRFLLPDSFDVSQIPYVITLILIACAHVYFMYRAYYSLKFSGIALFSIIYLLIAYYIGSMIGTAPSLTGLSWLLIFYLSLLYGYGVTYNFIDAALSGLLHTKGV